MVCASWIYTYLAPCAKEVKNVEPLCVSRSYALRYFVNNMCENIALVIETGNVANNTDYLVYVYFGQRRYYIRQAMRRSAHDHVSFMCGKISLSYVFGKYSVHYNERQFSYLKAQGPPKLYVPESNVSTGNIIGLFVLAITPDVYGPGD